MSTYTKWSLALTVILPLCAPGTAKAAAVVDDSYSVQRGTQRTIAAPGVLANDDCELCAVVSVVVDGQDIAFTDQISFGPGQDYGPLLSGASLTVHSDGSFEYDARSVSASVPMDAFLYRAEDSRGTSGLATVTITLTDQPVSSAPVANADQYTAELGSILTVPAPGLLANDTDDDGDPLTVSLVNGVAPSFGAPMALTYGMLTIQSDGSFSYEPDANAVVGADEGFSYTASDGTNQSNSAAVGISLVESTTNNDTAQVRFDDVGLVILDVEVGLTDVDQLEVGAAAGSLAQVSGGGLPSQTGALILRSSDLQTATDAREAMQGCERMALVAQAQPTKYDLVVEVHSDTPGTSFSVGGDGEIIMEVSQTRIKCWTDRVTGSSSP